MKAESFCYWLQGYFEISTDGVLDIEQANIVKNHLNMVFEHDIDPKMGDKEHQEVLNALHTGTMPTDKKITYRC